MLNGQEKNYPSISEWIKAGRGGITIPKWNQKKGKMLYFKNRNYRRKYPWGDVDPQKGKIPFANCKPHGKNVVPVVSSFKDESPYGCVNMAGNVREWCKEVSKKNPRKHFVCGSSWNTALRTFRRCYGTAYRPKSNIGIRFVIYGK